jgi:hypothetical protein
MDKVHITVVSKTPPGGRCEFYDRVFFEIVKAFKNVYYTLIPSELFEGDVSPPAVLLNGDLVEPEDGILLTPDELLRALKEKGAVPRDEVEQLKSKLEKAYDSFIGGV